MACAGKRGAERIEWALDRVRADAAAPARRAGNCRAATNSASPWRQPCCTSREILFLDEPTSGADPLARREFWQRITALAEGGVTVIVTTHFMEEAEYCDRIAILDAGRVLAEGTPAEVRSRAHPAEATMEDAFIAIVEEARAAAAPGAAA